MGKIKSFDTAVSVGSYECTLAVECCVFGFQDKSLKILLAKRSIAPYKDYWVLPGGAMNEGKTLDESLGYVLHNLTGIEKISFEQVACYSQTDRHPVKRVVSVSYYALVKPEDYSAMPKNYISDIQWFDIADVPHLGFDHQQLLSDALAALRENLRQNLVFGDLLPNLFTLTELQDLYETILNEQLDRRNFRKKILQMGLLKATNQKKSGVKGGPTLYKKI